jgi:hypothetical protein
MTHRTKPQTCALIAGLALFLTACGPPRAFDVNGGPDGGTRDGGPDGGGQCARGQARCNPTDPQQTQQCAPDGSGWVDGATCESNAGQTCAAGHCQDRCASNTLSYLGCEYWPTVTANSQLQDGFPFAVAVANPQTYTVRVRITGGTLADAVIRTVAPGEVATIELPLVPALVQNGTRSLDGFEVARSALVTHGAYRLRTDGPVAAYQFNPLTFRATQMGREVFSYTNDASLLLPTRALTGHYIVATRDNWQAHGSPDRSRWVLGGFAAVVGVDPNAEGTRVTVRLRAAVSAGTSVAAANADTTQTYNLRQGDVLQLLGALADEDLTGTVIESDHPVAVFTGHDCTNVPATRVACDHLEEQLLPSATWGRRYAITQPRLRGPSEPYRVRLVAQRAGVRYEFDGIAPPPECGGTYDLGQHCEFETTGNFVVAGNQPFLAVAFMVGQDEKLPECNAPGSDRNAACMGDPAMVTGVPIDQFRHAYDFLVPDTYGVNMVNVVVPIDAQVSLDGAPVTGDAAPVGSTHRVFFVPIAPGPHHIEAVGSAAVGVTVYGIARYTSYMYPGGLDLAPISPPG